MNKHFSIKVALGALAVVALAGAALATHSWNGYHWARKANPFTLQLVDSVTTGWDSYLGTTSTDWSASTVLDTVIRPGDTSSSTRKKCPAVLGKDRVCNAAYGNNGWLGLAQIWVYSNGHIAQGVIKVNDTYFNTTKYNTPGWRNLVMCQEVGHTFGLDHQDETFDNPNLGTCMDYTDDPDGTLKNQLSNQHPNQHDYDQLKTIYAHLDSSTTLSLTSASRGANRANAEEVAEFGKSLKRDGRGRTSLFERDLGKGEKVFTFVFWAE